MAIDKKLIEEARKIGGHGTKGGSHSSCGGGRRSPQQAQDSLSLWHD
jgi:hypothetical protein